jgi:hypothetical protein
MSRIKITFPLLLVLGLPLRLAMAGIADTPLPVLNPTKNTLHLYSVPFAPRVSPMAPVIACTSTDAAPMEVCVEFFSASGSQVSNDCFLSQLTVPPGGTVTFAPYNESGASWLQVDSETSGIGARSARVVATSKNLACHAFLVDTLSNPPTSMMQLTIIRKTKQKAAN